MKMVFCIYLLIGAIWDTRTQKLPGLWLWGGCIVAGIYAFLQIISQSRSIGNVLLSLIPGILGFCFVKISHAMGSGDAGVIFISGLVIPFSQLIQTLLTAFFLAAVGSMVYMLIKRNMQNKRIPFVPFIFFAASIVCGLK